MASREDLGSWLEGTPGGRRPDAASRLGIPANGPGSMASVPRRAVALLVDWVACLLISTAFLPSDAVDGALLTGDPWITLVIFAASTVVLVGTIGTTLGHRLLGLRVRRLDALTGAPGLWAAAVRTVLLCLVIPAVVWNGEGRGLHDVAARTVIVHR